jgi:tRNA threonylcarbamoyladenosine biosynthesis protein TsaE
VNEWLRLPSRTEDETRTLAARLASVTEPGDVIALVGELGAGKTRFVQGLAAGLGVPPDTPITSPTFTLLAIYRRGRLPLYHLDLYRLAGEADLARLGAEEYLWGDGVSAVEWAERAPAMMPEHALWVHLEFAAPGRELVFRSASDRWAGLRHAMET